MITVDNWINWEKISSLLPGGRIAKERSVPQMKTIEDWQTLQCSISVLSIWRPCKNCTLTVIYSRERQNEWRKGRLKRNGTTPKRTRRDDKHYSQLEADQKLRNRSSFSLREFVLNRMKKNRNSNDSGQQLNGNEMGLEWVWEEEGEGNWGNWEGNCRHGRLRKGEDRVIGEDWW